MRWQRWQAGMERALAVGVAGLAIAMLGLTMGGARAEAQPPATDGGTAEPPTMKCGAPGQVPCPLQAWMRRRIAGPLASSDWAALARGLEESAEFAPEPSWTAWTAAANAGASAARDGQIAAVRKACKQCHEAYRKEYRRSHRDRPLPR